MPVGGEQGAAAHLHLRKGRWSRRRASEFMHRLRAEGEPIPQRQQKEQAQEQPRLQELPDELVFPAGAPCGCHEGPSLLHVCACARVRACVCVRDKATVYLTHILMFFVSTALSCVLFQEGGFERTFGEKKKKKRKKQRVFPVRSQIRLSGG